MVERTIAASTGAAPAGAIRRARSRSGRAGPSDRLTSGSVAHRAGHARARPGMIAEKLDVEVQRELVRVRPQPDRVDLVLPLVLEPGLDEVGSEDVALQQEVVVLLQVVEHDVE